jgi:MoaA/NifB/PqqE/SkfB family radical SAM enzyme
MANLAYLQITRECNQRCLFCSNPPTGKSRSLSFFKKIIDSYIKKGYKGIIFSGGEPTLYPHLPNLISYVSRKNIHCRIITNGQKIADPDYLLELTGSGLEHICLSIYSDDPAIQALLTENKDSLPHIKKALFNLKRSGITVDIVTVINKYNSGHLSRLARWITRDFPFVNHFVWNNLDPLMNRASSHPDTIPRLIDFELELHFAMTILRDMGKTFRVERVPLCYMASFPHCSTETRKIVKQEERVVYFLDSKGLVRQKKWAYGKAGSCKSCSVCEICAGLYQMGKYFSGEELYPLFIDKNEIINKILSENE